MADVIDWTVTIGGVISQTYSVRGRTPEEAIDVATQDFHDEFGRDANIDEIVESYAFPDEDSLQLEEEELAS